MVFLPTPERHSRWQRGCMLMAGVALAGMIALCSMGSVGIRSGAIRPPWLIRDLGPVRLVSIETFTPQCATAFPCGRPLNIMDPELPRYYVVWIVVRWPSMAGAHVSAYRLLAQPIDPR